MTWISSINREVCMLKDSDVDKSILFRWLRDIYGHKINFDNVEIYNIEIVDIDGGCLIRFMAFPNSVTPDMVQMGTFWGSPFNILLSDYKGYLRDEKINNILNG